MSAPSPIVIHTDSAGRVARVVNAAAGLDMAFSDTGHPLFPSPPKAVFEGWSGLERRDRMTAREEQLRAMREEPLRHGWEPPVWRLTDAICQFPWVDPEFGERVRKKLGLPKPIKRLGLNGANRSAKTTYCMKRAVRLLEDHAGKRSWIFHQNNDMSVEYHQSQFWQFIPHARRRPVRDGVEYLAYKMATGFSENRAVFHNGSWASFRNYSQDKATIEGGEVDIIIADELCPLSWSKTLAMRVATRDGWLLHPFTPVDGYTELVGDLRDGAECVLDATGWLLPLDAKGVPDTRRAIELRDVLADVMGEPVPPARESYGFTGTPEPAKSECAGYARVPRVEKGRAAGAANVFFHSSDNPFGNPASVVERCLADGREDYIHERAYGVARKSWSARFNFDKRLHVLPPGAIPKDGTNLMIADPANARNWFMLWVRIVGERAYVYREWPTTWRSVKGHGNMAPWGVPGGAAPDGLKGPGQKSLGWGILRYKEEIARLEGWADATGEDPVSDWSESSARDERIYRRLMDSRYASNPKLEADRPETTLTQLEDIGIFFDTAPGGDIEDGLLKIDGLLFTDKTRAPGPGNAPQLYISAECPNLIDALSRYVGINPETGRIDMSSPLKDPIDCLRYALMCGTGDIAAADKKYAEAAPDMNAHY